MQPNEGAEETPGDEVDSTGTACGENPKSNKPLMEKRRRARINKSLNELKAMLLQALKGNSCGHSKLEKADILEMTVRYMRKLEQQRARTTRIDPAVFNKYKAGFNECRNEVMKFLSTHEGVSVDVRTRLLDHLASCQQSLQDQEQEGLMSEEFLGTDPSPSWRASPMQIADNAMRMSPSTSQIRSQEIDTNRQNAVEEGRASASSDPGSVSSSYIEGQIQILSTCTPSPPSNVSSISSPLQSPFKDVAIVLPSGGTEGGLFGNKPRTESRAPCPVYVQAISAGSDGNISASTHARKRDGVSQAGYATQDLDLRAGGLSFTMGYLSPCSYAPEGNFQDVAQPGALRNAASACPLQVNPPISRREDRLREERSGKREIFTQTRQNTGRDTRQHKSPWRPWSCDTS